MTEDSLKKYLKENAAPVPPSPLGESARIWRRIDGDHSRRRMWWALAPLLATAMAVAFIVHTQKIQNEARVEEEYLYQEWSAMMSDVNSDDAELITTFEK